VVERSKDDQSKWYTNCSIPGPNNGTGTRQKILLVQEAVVGKGLEAIATLVSTTNLERAKVENSVEDIWLFLLQDKVSLPNEAVVVDKL